MLDRRMLLAAAGGALAARGASALPSQPVALYAGTYAREGGAGVVRLAFQPGANRAAVVQTAPIPDASYGVWSPRHRRRYFVREADHGTIAAYHEGLEPRGDAVSSGGADPCYVALDPAQRALAVANYGSGTVGLIQLGDDGVPLGPAQAVAHHGSGPDRERQAGPHAHWVGFTRDARVLHAVDLGADAVFAHPYDASRRLIGEGEVAYAAPARSGPRHLARHPTLPLAYLVSELANSLTVLAERPGGRLEALQIVSTLPPGFTGHSQAAHIAADARGRRLYVSNRGADTVAVFALDAEGRPSLVQQIGSGGRWPRAFLLLDAQRRMLVANEHSGEIAVLDVLPDGRLQDGGARIPQPGVVFLST